MRGGAMTIAWGDFEIHQIVYDNGADDIVAGSQFELLALEGLLSGVIGKALIYDYDIDDYDAILKHEGFGVVISFAKDDVITIAAVGTTETDELEPYAAYIVDSFRMFLRRRSST